MKNIKLGLFLILGIVLTLPVMAASTFRIDYASLVQPSNTLIMEVAPVEITQTFSSTKTDFAKIDTNIVGRTDLQVASVLDERKTLLENTFQPVISETAINTNLANYKESRENQIRNEIQNVAEQNDEIGILYREVEEYEVNLRLELNNYLEREIANWEMEYVNLKEDMDDFVSYYNTNLLMRSAVAEEPVVTETKLIELIVETKGDYSDKVDAIEESQTILLSRLSASIEEEDNSLILDKNLQLLNTIESDQDILNAKLVELEDQKETIVALDEEIKLMEMALRSSDSDLLKDNPYAEMTTTDLVILREATSAELEKTLVTYETSQNDVQETLTSSITNLTSLELKR